MSEDSNFYELNLSASNSDLIFDPNIPIKPSISLPDNPQNLLENQQQPSLFQNNEENLSANNNDEDLNPKSCKTTEINQSKSSTHFTPFISYDYSSHQKSILSRNSCFTHLQPKNPSSLKSKLQNQEKFPTKNIDWSSTPSSSSEIQVDEALFTPVLLQHKIEFSPSVLSTEDESNEENSIQHEIQQFCNPGETFIKLKAKKHLDHNYIQQRLQNSGPITLFRIISYSTIIVQFQTHTMAIHALNRINNPTFMNKTDNPNQIRYKATIKTEDEINGLLEKRQRDLDTIFTPSKCLCVHGLDPAIDNISNLMKPFKFEEQYEIIEKNGEVTVYTYHHNAASVKDFISAFQDNLSGVPNTYVTEEPNRQIIQKVSKILRQKLVDDCVEDVKKLLAEDVISPAINRAINEDNSYVKFNRISCKSTPLIQPEISMPPKSIQTLSNLQNEAQQIKRSSSNPLDFCNNRFSNFNMNNNEFNYTNNSGIFGQKQIQNYQQMHNYQQMQNMHQYFYENDQQQQMQQMQNYQPYQYQNENDHFQQIMQQQQYQIQTFNQGQFMNYNNLYYTSYQQQQQTNPYLLSSSSSFPNQQQLFIQQMKPQKNSKQTKQQQSQQKIQKQKETNNTKHKQQNEEKSQKNTSIKFTSNNDSEEKKSPRIEIDSEINNNNINIEKGRYLNFYIGSRSNLTFFLSNPRSTFSSQVRSEAKRHKKQLLGCGSDARNYERETTKKMEQETTFESIKQPSIENNSSRLTPIHKIEEWHKRAYLRPYASMRRNKYVVARKSGLPILKSQFSENEPTIKKGNIGKRVYFEKSEIQGYGLFALEPISPKDFICEYTGQLIRMEVADRREKKLSKKGFQHMYLFRLGQMVIDATEHGSNARFLNHSCSPNCRARQITIKDMQTISFFATKKIKPHDEIAFNYEMELENDPSKWEKCYCGSKDCNGYLNYSFRRSTLNKMWMQANNLDENSDDSA